MEHILNAETNDHCSVGILQEVNDREEIKKIDTIWPVTDGLERDAVAVNLIASQLNENAVHTESCFVEQETCLNHIKCTTNVEEVSVIPPLCTDVIAQQCASLQSEEQCQNLKQQIQQLRAALIQKENTITLFQRENNILEKEKQAFRKEKEFANKEKESTVIKFAVKEKLLLDAKKEKLIVEKQLAEAKKEVKNVSARLQAMNEEKSRITYLLDEKCNELRKYQRECEKLKTDNAHLESKLKYHINKLNMEIEAKVSLEKKLEDERNAPQKLTEKAIEKLKMEYEANTILLKHEIDKKSETSENLSKKYNRAIEHTKLMQEQVDKEIAQRKHLETALAELQDEHTSVQNAYSEEILNAAKLRSQVDELQLLRTQNTLNKEKIVDLSEIITELEKKCDDNDQVLHQLRAKEEELLNINLKMSSSIVGVQNEICLLKANVQGIDAENTMLKNDKHQHDTQLRELNAQLADESSQRAEERTLLTKHLSEKTKLYEIIKDKLDHVMGDFEATKTKHAAIVKELQRELLKKTAMEYQWNGQASAKSFPTSVVHCSNCQIIMNGLSLDQARRIGSEDTSQQQSRSYSSNQSGRSSRCLSESSESETVASNVTAIHGEMFTPSKEQLVERILRLQQASARQTEKIDFLENHTLALVTELQNKSKLVQNYMLREQAGVLTSSKSDEHKSDLSKYGHGVMSAIYGGLKGDNKSMTLELSLEINKKLQAVLEDTLLKNITLKENLDVLGLEVDNLTRRIRQLEKKE